MKHFEQNFNGHSLHKKPFREDTKNRKRKNGFQDSGYTQSQPHQRQTEKRRSRYEHRQSRREEDSQAPPHALKSPRITSQVIFECINSLATLGQRNKVRLVCVPGYSDVACNEEADALARKGSSDTFTGPEPAIGLPYSYPQGSIDNCTREKCPEDWSRGIGLRQARLLS
ncbi:hypothetical protein NQ315_008351 [Exocentrus adspersus]|uniref:RNase H type-1 domain-containing protein n=1 Tax=Exocentrus adspersus TaxID=1586481 RepID=A0AAV8VRA7_9CUCU|nr:hypothetical protein NQ315_008351 [Exocentrus adspersus]